MATIHRTTLVPTKLELISAWLPRQPWYRPAGTGPDLQRAGGFRLDDPAGEVGLECMLVTDRGDGTTYFVPLSYRGAPLGDAEEGLIGTSEHGVLGRRWIYDAAHDPVAVAQLLALVSGEAGAQHQDRSDTPDPSVGRRWTGEGRPRVEGPLAVAQTVPDRTTVVLEADGGPGASLELVRVVRVGESAADDGIGSVDVQWDGGRGTVVVLR